MPTQQNDKKQNNLLQALPQDVFKHTLSSFLDPKSLTLFANSSYSFYQETQHVDYWKNKLMKLNYHQDDLTKILQINVISNYRNFYRNLSLYPRYWRQDVVLWEVLCLSGEVAAIQYAIDHENLTADAKGLHGQNALHLAGRSGSVLAIQFVLKTLKISVKSVDERGRNLMLYAAASSSKKALEFVIHTLKLSADDKDKYGAGLMHHAAHSATTDMMEYVDQILEKFYFFDNTNRSMLHYASSLATLRYGCEIIKIPLNIDKKGRNVLHMAAFKGEVAMMRYAHEILKISALDVCHDGMNALHYAVWGNALEAIQYAHQVLKIPVDSCDFSNANALHHAGLAGSVDIIKYVCETFHIPVNSQDVFGKNVLHYAVDYSVDAVKYVIEVLKIPANSCDKGGRNALHYASFIEPFIYMLQLSYQFNLKLESSLDHQGHDAFWYADRSPNAKKCKMILGFSKDFVLQSSIEKIKSQCEQELKKEKTSSNCLMM